MIHKSIRVPLYHQRLQIIICDDVEKEIEEVNKKFPTSCDRFDFSGYAEASLYQFDEMDKYVIYWQQVKQEIL